jgi:2-polyprenyl-3-methyl-5-hydroxy-6-metoxy-1,4-benzoquinol methylase
MIKESIIYLIRALNPVALLSNRAQQVQMLKQIARYLRISLNPVTFERDRMRQLRAKDKEIRAKRNQIQTKDRRILALEAKVEELLGSKEAAYWEIRYDLGGTSGAGSVGDSRAWKWEAITKYVSEVEHVVDVGCGDLSFWEGRECQDYTGIDISTTVIAKDRRLRPGWTFIASPGERRVEELHKDCVFCLDLLFHVMEDENFHAILDNLCYYSTNYIFIYNWWRNPWAEAARGRDSGKGSETEATIPHTDGKYQYFRALEQHLQVFDNNRFQLVDAPKYNDGIGALYVLKKRT